MVTGNNAFVMGFYTALVVLLLCFSTTPISCQRSKTQPTKKPSTRNKQIINDNLPCIQYFDDHKLPISDELENYPDSPILGRVIGTVSAPGFTPYAYSISDIKAIFHLYTRQGNSTDIMFEHRHKRPEELDPRLCDTNRAYPFAFPKLHKARFNPRNPTVIMIPGYRTDSRPDWMYQQIDDWLELKDVNLILATWSSANSGRYDRAVSNVPYVGREITILLHYLTQISGFEMTSKQEFLDNIHIIGHSLGAHIAGAVGRDFNGAIGRISGLDPAGPSFDAFEPLYRLDRTDAKLVDVYHSNMGKFDQWTFVCGLYHDTGYFNPVCRSRPNQGPSANPNQPGAFMGINYDIGHVDYYLNNGFMQPGCNDWSNCCDHSRVTELLADSIKLELELRDRFGSSYNNDTSSIGKPIALKASNYASFQFGTNLGSENAGCKWLLNDPNSALPAKGDISSCSVPIDFSSAPIELRDYLMRKHGIVFDSELSTRVFLATPESRPLVGDHFLLKLKFGPDSDWHRSCDFTANVFFTNKATRVLISRGLKQPRAGSIMTIPIRPPRNVQARATLEKLAHKFGPDIFVAKESSIRKNLLPSAIYFTSHLDTMSKKMARKQADNSNGRSSRNNNDTTGYNQRRRRSRNNGRTKREIASVADGSNRLMDSALPKCILDITYVAVQPIWDKPQTFYGIFTVNASYTGPYDVMESSGFRVNNETNRVRVEPYRYKHLHLNQMVVDF